MSTSAEVAQREAFSGQCWGNPYRIGPDGSRDEEISKFSDMLDRSPPLLRQLGMLTDKVLVCHCASSDKCHADAIIAAYVRHFDPKLAVVYVGQGCAELKLSPSQWSSPFRIGPDGTPEECLAKYTAWLRHQPQLRAAIRGLRGRTLVCDCDVGAPCHADVLIAWAAEGGASDSHSASGVK